MFLRIQHISSHREILYLKPGKVVLTAKTCRAGQGHRAKATPLCRNAPNRDICPQVWISGQWQHKRPALEIVDYQFDDQADYKYSDHIKIQYVAYLEGRAANSSLTLENPALNWRF